MQSSAQIKDLFLLDPNVVYLNHGSFGACPQPVFEVYQDFQRQLERQPMDFLSRRSTSLMQDARSNLADYLGVLPEEIVYFPNPSTAINMVARNLTNQNLPEKHLIGGLSLPLKPGDEILSTDHEYGAMNRTWRYVCKHSGVHYIQHNIPLPLPGNRDLVDRFWEKVTPRTRVIFISHITSPTALLFPVAEICQRARQLGILTIVDGAHAIGQIPLNLKNLGADIYTGACHKWLCAPKGSAFLFIRKEIQDRFDPLVISWGYDPDPGYGSGIKFVDYNEWQGTRDLSAFLSVPTAIDFQNQYNWHTIRRRCHDLCTETRQRVNKLTGFDPICAPENYMQMFSARLPANVDTYEITTRLEKEYRIVALLITWNEMNLIRISLQGYNDQSDVDALLYALERIL